MNMYSFISSPNTSYATSFDVYWKNMLDVIGIIAF